jgi:hypothetical protein
MIALTPTQREAIPDDVVDLCRRLHEHGERGWIVGGCIRDVLLGRPIADWDVAPRAPDRGAAHLPQGHPHGHRARHGHGAAPRHPLRGHHAARRGRLHGRSAPRRGRLRHGDRSRPGAARLHGERHRVRPARTTSSIDPFGGLARPRGQAAARRGSARRALRRRRAARPARRALRGHAGLRARGPHRGRLRAARIGVFTQGERRARARRVAEGHEGPAALAWRSTSCAAPASWT